VSRGGIGSHTNPYRGNTDDWLTPPEIIVLLGPFDLDPCCPPTMPWDTAKRMVRLPEDGMAAAWEGRVWLNPPYGPETGRWLSRLAEHGRGTALMFARTETDMFFEFVWRRATALLFLRGRLHFYRPDGRRAVFNSGGPSVLVAYGEADAEVLRAVSESGTPGPVGAGMFVRLRWNLTA